MQSQNSIRYYKFQDGFLLAINRDLTTNERILLEQMLGTSDLSPDILDIAKRDIKAYLL